MKKFIKGLIVMACMIAFSTVAFAYTDFSDNMPDVHIVGDYAYGQVVVEIFDIETGVVESREYFDVVVPVSELIAGQETYVPQRAPRLMVNQQIWLPGRGTWSNIAHANTGTNLSHSMWIQLNSHPGGILYHMQFQFVSGNLGTNLGSGRLRAGQAAIVNIPFNTLSYSVFATNVTHNGFAAANDVIATATIIRN